jgi:hypothetical protein
VAIWVRKSQTVKQSQKRILANAPPQGPAVALMGMEYDDYFGHQASNIVNWPKN